MATKKNEVPAQLELEYSSPRAVFLAAETRVIIPKRFEKMIPNGQVLNMIAQNGIEGTKILLDQESDDQLNELYEEGAAYSPAPGTEQEYRMRIARGLYDEIITRDDLTYHDKIEQTTQLGLWVQSSKVNDLVEKTSGNISKYSSLEILSRNHFLKQKSLSI